MKILFVYAHSQPTSFNAALLDQATKAAREGDHEVIVSNLYAMGFNPVASEADFKGRRFPGHLQYDREQKYAAEHNSFSDDIAAEIEDLAAAVRRGSLDPRTCVGGATSIANLGMFGISKVRTIVSPPHATLLAVGAVEERPVVIAGALSVAAMMSCTLSCDRRLVDGAVAARLVASLRAYIEEPLRMLV